MGKKLATAGAVGGGAVGAYFGGPVGAAAGSSLGAGLGGLYGQGQDPYSSKSFSDIDLKTENPELYAELMKYGSLADEAENLYRQRSAGYSQQENADMAQNSIAFQNRLSNQGLLGTSAGLSAQSNAEAQMRDQILQRAFQEKQALLQNAEQARANYAQSILGAQQAVLQPQNAAALFNYQNGQAEQQAKNQLFSGLLSSGLGLAAQGYNTNQMTQQREADRALFANNMRSPVSDPGFGYSAGVPNVQMSPYQGLQYGGY